MSFDLELKYRAGKENANVDVLSRFPIARLSTGGLVSRLPIRVNVTAATATPDPVEEECVSERGLGDCSTS